MITRADAFTYFFLFTSYLKANSQLMCDIDLYLCSSILQNFGGLFNAQQDKD